MSLSLLGDTRTTPAEIDQAYLGSFCRRGCRRPPRSSARRRCGGGTEASRRSGRQGRASDLVRLDQVLASDPTYRTYKSRRLDTRLKTTRIREVGVPTSGIWTLGFICDGVYNHKVYFRLHSAPACSNISAIGRIIIPRKQLSLQLVN